MSEAGASAPIRVLVVDDHQMFAESLARVLSADDDIETVAIVGSLDGAIAAAAEHAPDVAIIDFQLGDDSDIDAAQAVRSVSPSTRVLMLTGLGTEQVL